MNMSGACAAVVFRVGCLSACTTARLRFRRQEFRRHKTAKPEFLVGFFREWEAYARHLEQSAPAAVGRDLEPEHVAGLSEEQRVSHALCIVVYVNLLMLLSRYMGL